MSTYDSRQRGGDTTTAGASTAPPSRNPKRDASMLDGYAAQSAALQPSSPVPSPVPVGMAIDRARAIKKALLDGWFGEDEEGALDQIRGASVSLVAAIRAEFTRLTGRVLERVFKDKCNGGQYREALAIIWPALSLIEKVETNVSRGFFVSGDNEDGILDAIRTASQQQLDEAAASTAFSIRIRELLNDDQYYEARKILTPNNMLQIVIQRIENADGRFNDDEGAVYDSILDLSVAHRRVLWDNFQHTFKWMSGSERQRVQTMCLGTEAEALSTRLEDATSGLGTDDDAVRLVAEKTRAAAQRESALTAELSADAGQLSEEERGAAQAELKALGGIERNLLTAHTWTSGALRSNTFLGRLSGDVSDSDFDAYAAQMGVSDFDRAKQAILSAPGFFNDDEDAIKDAIRSVPDLSVRTRLWEDEDIKRALKCLGKNDHDTVFVLAQASEYSKATWELRQADDDDTRIYRALIGMSPQDRQRLVEEKPPVWRAMPGKLNTAQWSVAEYIVRYGTIPTTMAIDVATGSWYDGTDEDLIKLSFDHMDPSMRATYRLGYHAARHGATTVHEERSRAAYLKLESKLEGELGGDDLLESIDKLLGTPTAAEMQTEEGRMLAARIISTRTGEKVEMDAGISELLTSTDETMEQAGTQVEAAFGVAVADGKVSMGELAVLAAHDERFNQRYGEFVARANMIRNIASTVAAVAAGVVVTIASGGTLGPVVAAALTKFGIAGVVAAAGTAGALTRVGTSKAFGGDQYDTFGADGMTDLAVGTIDGALTVLSAGLAARFTSLVGLSGEKLTAQVTAQVMRSSRGAVQFTGGRLVGGAVESAVDGAIGGALGEVAFTMADERIWRESVWDIMGQVGQAIIRGGGIGMATGGVLGAGPSIPGSRLRINQARNAMGHFDQAGIYVDDMTMPQLRIAGRAEEGLRTATTKNAAGKQQRAFTDMSTLQNSMDHQRFREFSGGMLDTYGHSIDDYAAVRVDQLRSSGSIKKGGFHGTNSKLLEPEALGSEASQGQLLSESEMNNRGITRSTGEGDTFSGRSGAKTDVFMGIGEPGMGTGAAYAQLNMTSSHYNPSVLTWDELVDRLKRADDLVIRFEELPPEIRGLQARMDKTRIEGVRGKLQREYDIRVGYPAGHPIRVGGLENNTTYAVLFEFDKSSMQVRPLNRQAGGPLGGEAMTPTMIDLPKVVQRVYVPKNKMDDALVRLRKIFGHDRFEVLPIETLSDYTGSKHLRGSMDSTLSAIEGIDRQTDELLKSMHQKLMAP